MEKIKRNILIYWSITAFIILLSIIVSIKGGTSPNYSILAVLQLAYFVLSIIIFVLSIKAIIAKHLFFGITSLVISSLLILFVIFGNIAVLILYMVNANK